MTVQRVKVVRSLFHANDRAAEAIRARCDAAGVVAVNLLAGPGAGKTSLITRTIAALAGTARVGVVEGDIAGSVDTERVLAAGAVDAVQVNTAGGATWKRACWRAPWRSWTWGRSTCSWLRMWGT